MLWVYGLNKLLLTLSVRGSTLYRRYHGYILMSQVGPRAERLNKLAELDG